MIKCKCISRINKTFDLFMTVVSTSPWNYKVLSDIFVKIELFNF